MSKVEILLTILTLIVTVFIPRMNCSFIRADKILTFWQISDIHLDVFYSLNGDPDNWCHRHNNNNNNETDNNNNETDNNNNNNETDFDYNIDFDFDYDSESSLGKFGDFRCEANWNLVTSAFELMKRDNPDPGSIKNYN